MSEAGVAKPAPAKPPPRVVPVKPPATNVGEVKVAPNGVEPKGERIRPVSEAFQRAENGQLVHKLAPRPKVYLYLTNMGLALLSIFISTIFSQC